jgi:hypothetical protein
LFRNTKDFSELERSGQHDTGKFEKGEYDGLNLGFGAAISSRHGGHNLKEYDIRDAVAAAPLLDGPKGGGSSGRLCGIIAQEAAKEDVGIEELLAHLLPRTISESTNLCPHSSQMRTLRSK